MSAIYDQIGVKYDITRKADPEITRRLYNHLQIFDNNSVIDIACGTGNYTISLKELGVNIAGVDVSRKMIMSASKKTSQIHWSIGDVKNLPFKDNEFKGATCVLAIHHFDDLYKSFNEIYRVLDVGSRFVIFTSSPEQMERYWLMKYFPQMMNKSLKQMPSIENVNKTLEEVGFSLIGNETFLIQPNLEDFFLYSGKYKPEMYLSEEVRNGISSFTSLAEPEEVREGLIKLIEDLHNGNFNKQIKNYNSNLGDYVFITAEKK